MIPLTIFCASHIDSKERLEGLRKMLTSAQQQTILVPLFLSFSYKDKELLKDTLNLLLEFRKLGLDIKTILQHTPLAIFEHYEKIIANENFDSQYVIFTDDNDTWHEDRNAAYLSMIKSLEKNKLYVGRLNKYKSWFTDCSSNDDGGEHWMYVCHIDVIRKFFEVCPELHLQNKYCDLIFIRFLCQIMGENIITDNSGMCFYTQKENKRAWYENDIFYAPEEIRGRHSEEIMRVICLLLEEKIAKFGCQEETLCKLVKVQIEHLAHREQKYSKYLKYNYDHTVKDILEDNYYKSLYIPN